MSKEFNTIYYLYCSSGYLGMYHDHELGKMQQYINDNKHRGYMEGLYVEVVITITKKFNISK